MKLLMSYRVVLMLALYLFSGCSSYYRSYLGIEEQLQKGDYKKAESVLDSDKYLNKPRNRLLYHLNKGYLLHLQAKHDSSNHYFNAADIMIEDYKANIGAEIGSYFFNPTITPYKAEHFETIMIHYYKALNYMNLRKYDDALVEARRINLKLQILNDRYKDKKDKYQNDAFAHILMGLIYDAQKDYNNAFIAYRNAYELFNKGGKEQYMNVSAPQQLKKDLIRVANASGNRGQADYFSKKFNLPLKSKFSEDGEVVFFWENGRSPYKSQSFITFLILPGDVGWVRFVNEEYNINLPFYIGDMDKEEQEDLFDLKIFKMAIPKYIQRSNVFTHAMVEINDTSYNLEPAEDINAIAFKSLRDRLAIELSKSLLRLATKKAAEYAVRSKNETAGAVIGFVNAISEQADTRGWFTLPSMIAYTRVPLKKGDNNMALKLLSNNRSDTVADIKIEGNGDTYFFNYQSLEFSYSSRY